MFSNINFDEFWKDSNYSQKRYIMSEPTDREIEEVEKIIGYKLPQSYIELMKKHNGGLVKKCLYPCNENNDWDDGFISITGILGIGFDENKNSIVQGKSWAEEWEYPNIGVVICDCPSAGHDMVFLDYRDCKSSLDEPSVVYVEQEFDYKIIKLANNFEEFIKVLVSETNK